MYPKTAYTLVKQAIDEVGTTETREVFQQLDKILRKRYVTPQFSAPLWKRVLGIVYTSDLEKIIREVADGGAVEAD